jgi:DNA-binding Lrp family transcriptional regulator
MTIKKVANELFDINDKSRKEDIINFLRNNPGCSKEELVKGVKNIVSKKTVIKILKELESEEQIKIEKEKPNSRSYKLFLCSENILIVLDKQIRDINEAFRKLLEKIEIIIPELTLLLPFTNKKNIDTNLRIILFYEQLPLFILKYLMQCLLLKSIIVWPKFIQKEEVRNKLNSLVFSEVSKIISDYSNYYNNKLTKNNIHQVNYKPNISDELIKLENNILYFAFFLLICKKKGIAKEFENLVDKIWLINSDVQMYLHPEAIRYNLSYEYGKDDWRKYLKLYKQHIIRIDKLENDKKYKLSNFISDLNIRDFF